MTRKRKEPWHDSICPFCGEKIGYEPVAAWSKAEDSETLFTNYEEFQGLTIVTRKSAHRTCVKANDDNT